MLFRSIPDEELGEVVTRGDHVMEGYFGAAAAEGATKSVVDGWLRTGDIGRLDAEGYLYLADRRGDMIITGGYNVFSAEVESAINAHDAVENCAVIGVPDPKWGEMVTAIVLLRPGRSLSEDDVIEFAKQRLGSVKAPKKVEFWPEIGRAHV